MEEKIIDSICLWSDLLGYGRNFYISNWEITTEEARQNIKRIKELQSEWTNITAPFHETVFTLNDGLVRNYDLKLNNFAMFLSWIEDAIMRFNRINQYDVDRGYPGIRGVMALGQRIEYIDGDYTGLGEFIQTSPERKDIYNKKLVVYSPRELQMNTAFSKAYIIEGSGSKMGVAGNKLYIDYSVIEKIVNIANNGIRDVFGRIDDDLQPPANYEYEGRFIEYTDKAVLTIKTICGKSCWTSFRVVFETGKEYLNEKQSISTRLFVPLKIESALFGQRR